MPSNDFGFVLTLAGINIFHQCGKLCWLKYLTTIYPAVIVYLGVILAAIKILMWMRKTAKASIC